MAAQSGMRLIALAALLAGFGFCVWLFMSHDLNVILRLLMAIGGTGAVAVVGVHIPPLFFTALAWRALIPGGPKPGPWRMTLIRWIGEAVNSMLPVAQIGGDFARAALLARENAGRLGSAGAGASVVADMTLALITQFFFTLLGAFLFLMPGRGEDQWLGVLVALLLAALVMGVIIMFQRLGGLFACAVLLERIDTRARWQKLAGGLRKLDHSLASIYADRRATIYALGWHSFGWASHAVETWVALLVLGHPISFQDAIIIESLASAVRSAAFAIPGGLGAQEGALLFLGLEAGLTAETALAMALLRRLREIATGLPGLWLWWRFSGPVGR